jgi:hypothetical protein
VELVALSDSEQYESCDIEVRRLTTWAEIDRRGLWKVDGCRDMAEWVAGRYGMSKWDAHRRLTAARALEGLPRIADALRAGVLSPARVFELTRFATPKTEKQLIEWARHASVSAIRRRADRACRSDPEDDTEAVRSRFVRWSFSDHCMWLEGLLPAAEGKVVAKALTQLAERLPDLPHEERCGDLHGPWCDDGTDARRADALFLLVSGGGSHATDASRASINVHTVLSGADGTVFSEIDGHPLARDLARELSCDARLRFILTDEKGDALGIGRTSRNVPPWLEAEVRFRDGGRCTFSGCEISTFLKSHHVLPWEEGGPTELDNLTTVCHHHHMLIHRFGWTVALDGPRTDWFRPTGERYLPGPAPPPQLSFT